MLRKKIEALSEDISNMTKVYVTLSNKENEYQTAVEEFTLRKEVFISIIYIYNRYYKNN